MRVLHLETGRSLYGGARQVRMLAGGLAAGGVASAMACVAGSGPGRAAPPAGVDLVPLESAGELNVALAWRVAAAARRWRADLVHVHSRRGADTWGLAGARLAGVPAVLTRRVDNPRPRWLARGQARAAAALIAISHAVVDQWGREGVAARRIRRVPSAVDPGTCVPRWDRTRLLARFGLPDDAEVVAVAAQLIGRKNHAGLLAAWPAVLSARPRARLLLFGRGPLEAALRRRVAAAGFAASVQFAGWCDELREFLARVDLLVHPARREALGMVLLEAQAAAVPVVALRVPGVDEAVADGVSGLLVPPDDPAALAGAVARVLGDPALRAGLGAGGRAHVARHFAPAAMVAGNLDVYRELLEGRHGGRARSR